MMTREEAIKWVTFDLESWEHQCLSYHPTKEALKMAIKALKQPEQKKAKWVKDKTNQLYCSACGQYGVYSEKVGTLYTFYCPYCGAKMEGEQWTN